MVVIAIVLTWKTIAQMKNFFLPYVARVLYPAQQWNPDLSYYKECARGWLMRLILRRVNNSWTEL